MPAGMVMMAYVSSFGLKRRAWALVLFVHNVFCNLMLSVFELVPFHFEYQLPRCRYELQSDTKCFWAG
jgi:hypothetical protein